MEEKTLFGSFYNLFVSIAFSALFLSTLTEGFVGEVAFYNLAHVSSVFEDVLIQAIVRTSLLVVLTHFVLKVTFETNSPLNKQNVQDVLSNKPIYNTPERTVRQIFIWLGIFAFGGVLFLQWWNNLVELRDILYPQVEVIEYDVVEDTWY